MELQRQFSLMRELDERSYSLQQQVDADMLTQLKLAAERQQGALHAVGSRNIGQGSRLWWPQAQPAPRPPTGRPAVTAAATAAAAAAALSSPHAR